MPSIGAMSIIVVSVPKLSPVICERGKRIFLIMFALSQVKMIFASLVTGLVLLLPIILRMS